ncbi:MAG: hypothetical protein LBI02_09930 [Opitutaceae bacterium]|jgi:hypothetical protein|nr:hypothetical protein [Opitutaceae bacterium]
MLEYRLRWGIEWFFAQLKSRGLNFEATPLRAGLRLERLCAVLAVPFVLAYANGLHRQARRAAPGQKNGHRVQSLFRRGLEDFTPRLLAGRLPLFGQTSLLPALHVASSFLFMFCRGVCT